MTVEEAIIARILTLSPVTALTSTRWWLLKLPQSPVYPAGRVQLIDDPEGYHLRGPDGTTRARVQVDMYVDEHKALSLGRNPYDLLAEIADAVDGDGKGPDATGLSGWHGDIGSPAFHIQGCFRIDRGVRYDPEELQVLTMSQDYYVWGRQT